MQVISISNADRPQFIPKLQAEKLHRSLESSPITAIQLIKYIRSRGQSREV